MKNTTLKIFSDTTAESLNHGHSTMSLHQTSKPNNTKEKDESKNSQVSSAQLMMNITSTMFKSEKKSAVKEHKKMSFLNTQDQPSETMRDESSNMIINPKVMEVWLNDILAEAQELGLKTAYLKADKTKPISQFGIDRQTLGKLGLNTEVTNRLYRGLFVYSVGFFELIK